MIVEATKPRKQSKTIDRVVVKTHGLRKSFGGHVVLDNVDFSLKAGEVVLLRGDNGSGKTTLLNILTGNLQPDAGEIVVTANGTTENFRFPRPWWTNLNPFDHFTPERVAAEGIVRTWQDIRLFRTQSILSNVMIGVPKQIGQHPFEAVFNPLKVGRRNKEVADKCRADIGNVGLAGRENSSADKISLGQSKRVAILRAINAGAKILFLDEPLSGLDGAGVAEIMGVLQTLASNHQITLVIVVHVFNIPLILEIANTV